MGTDSQQELFDIPGAQDIEGVLSSAPSYSMTTSSDSASPSPAVKPKSGFSLWLSPAQDENLLTDLIVGLTHKSSPLTLPFQPHTTLFADSRIPPQYTLDDIVAATKRAVAEVPDITKVTCSFEAVEAGRLFFQCVYIKLHKDERKSKGLLEIHRALRKSFGDSQDPEGEGYFPHASLVYGDIPFEERERIIKNLRDSGEVSSVEEEKENGTASVIGLTDYVTDEILVVKTAGRSDEWTIEARIPLCGKTITHEDL